ncbi:hypothetical protein BX616_010187 [Lobosporangium transversale]|uniref:Putative serine esterase-domain-containing protein n=1 Tax=Lobosporangium transversale TaxID=64571 RepID=A0A1Y2GP86_9FUNG|nr:putative serine esterase-domain-containing protein [Lobosporangium transversale]KAF9912986.1 hypothetical protein BX616_010187 [Lobosporangium transversale]ORZ15992.1 putative serine esterase-domain-containing protein [Lobosporangium transversale]|eukprot:XP_021881339.1 putative serine esterase-domain-containing protein [Lobosporangium transversale]
MSMPNEAHEGVHLVILHHGLWGNKGHLKFIAQQFKKRFGDRILVYRAESNESSLTYDGIDICGQRAVQEIHEVVRVIEAGGNISELQGRKNKGKKKANSKSKTNTTHNKKMDDKKISSIAPSSDLSLDSSSESNNSQQIPPSAERNNNASSETQQRKKVTQLSFLGYSLGGLIGRFAIGLLAMEKFFDPLEEGGRGIQPMYFVTMATPHLGIRMPPKSIWSKMFNYLSSRMLSRTGEQMQLIDDYVNRKPLLLVMSEPESVFVKALARFKRRALYCNIRNDRSVPFWTASFSDADPFQELEAMEIQYDSGYSSLIESFEHLDMETLERMKQEREESLKSASFIQRTSQKLTKIPWKKYALYGLLGPLLIPLWIVFASTTIGLQGLTSRKRTKNMVTSNEALQRIRERASAVTLEQYRDDDATGIQDDVQDLSKAIDINSTSVDDNAKSAKDDTRQEHNVVSVVEDVPSSSSSISSSREVSALISYSYPDLKSIRPLALLPVQVEISRNLNKLEWKKNIVHIEGWNSHASIVVREKRFSNDGGVAAVQHAVDMFKEDGEDE